MAALGPFYVADYKAGSYVLLKKNSNYWKTDKDGKKLPYLDGVRLDIQPNRDIETLRFRRSEIDLINSIDAEYYDRIAETSPSLVRDAGPSLDSEQMWFNQVARAPIPAYKLQWFHSQAFRRAVSESINREDLARVAFSTHAKPAMGPVSPANRVWFNSTLKPIPYDTASALRRLQQEGFHLDQDVLRDKQGHQVEFSIMTNAGNKYRERMATMIQQDLGKIGIKVNVLTLDFPSMIERMTQSFNYEAALLGLTNVDVDPNAQMTVWMSNGDNHQWNPQEKSPETPWEAEIDRLMQQQASSTDFKVRKAAFDKVQEIVAEQAPFIYLINKNALMAISNSVQGEVPVALRPQSYWNIDRMSLNAETAKARQ
jgi:peptide/nickel transport system substrate-binding protein